MEPLDNAEDVDRVFEEPLALLFKHSPLCGISARAEREMLRFVAEHPEHRVHIIDVIRSRGASSYVEQRTGIRHESPQVFVVKNGDIVWHDSHGGVTAEAVALAVL